MAKRKRLTPPAPDQIGSMAPLETKAMPSYPNGVAPTRTFRAPPIADVAADASGAAAAAEMAETLRQAREEGRLVLRLPLAAVQADYLVRDRTLIDDGDMAALKSSLSARGQQTPIEVVALGSDRYGLISGWRRLRALRALQDEDETGKFDTVLALLRQPKEASDAYQAMVEENEIRVGLSYYERARIALKAVDQGVFETTKDALLALFRSASRAKRSKIRSFLTIVQALDGALCFPEAMGERLGLSLAQGLSTDAGLADRLRRTLKATPPQSAEAERACIEVALNAPKQSLNKPKMAVSTVDEFRPAPGLLMRVNKKGQITLAGEAVTETFRDALVAWLSEQNKG